MLVRCQQGVRRARLSPARCPVPNWGAASPRRHQGGCAQPPCLDQEPWGGQRDAFCAPEPPKKQETSLCGCARWPPGLWHSRDPHLQSPQNWAEPGERALGPLCPIPGCIFPFPLVPPPPGEVCGKRPGPLAGALGRGPLCNRTPLRGPAPGMPAPRGGCQGLTKGERL